MVDHTHASPKVAPKKIKALADDHCLPRGLNDQELPSLEEALVLANPTPEEDEAFHEYLRKNGSGGGDP